MAIQFIKDVIYHLKRDYGSPVTFGTETISVNLATGVKTLTKSEFSIRNVIVLPETFSQKFRLLLANSNRNEAGLVKSGEVQIVVDKSDLPIGKTIAPDTYAIMRNQKYIVHGSPEDYVECLIVQLNTLKGVALP